MTVNRDWWTHPYQAGRHNYSTGAGFPDARPSLFDRHPFLCTLAIIVATVAGCFALFAGVMPR